MNTVEPSASTPTGPHSASEARDIDSSSSHTHTNAESRLSSSISSSRSHSSISSRNHARTQQSQQSQGPFTEITPINGASGSSRGYQTTEPLNANGGYKDGDGNNNGSTNQSRQTNQPEQPDEHQRSRLGRFVDRFGSLELENKGSVARDHLALERTFLAWIRTSLAFASIGIAVTQLFRLNTATATTDAHGTALPNDYPGIQPPRNPSSLLEIFASPSSNKDMSKLRGVGKPLGSTFIGMAILILIIGFHRYFESQYWVVRGKFPASRGSVILTAFVAGALIIAALAVILAISPSAYET